MFMTEEVISLSKAKAQTTSHFIPLLFLLFSSAFGLGYKALTHTYPSLIRFDRTNSYSVLCYNNIIKMFLTAKGYAGKGEMLQK